MKKNKDLLYDTNEKPTPGKWIILAMQHIFAMFGATILVPLLVNEQAGAQVLSIPVTLIASGIGTIVYILCTKGKSPVYLGSSFAYITPMAVAYAAGGTNSVVSGLVAVGIVYILVSLIIKIFGKDWIDKLLPPVVIGPMIMIIGFSLAPNAIAQMGLTAEVLDWKIILVSIITFLVTAITAVGAKGFFKIIPFLIGIVTGYILSIIVGIVDFTPIIEAPFFSIPNIMIPFKDYNFTLVGVLSILPIALVTIAEHVGDHMALSNIIGKNLLKDPGLERSLLGDGLATLTSGLIGGPANTTYGENTSVVGMTKVASVWVIGLAAIITIIISFFGKITQIFATIPNPVLGGVSLLLYGFISINGFKVLMKNKVNFEELRNVVIASAMLVIGLGTSVTTSSLPITGMSLAALVGIILNLILPNKEKNIKAKEV